MTTNHSKLGRFHPELSAGGFTRHDGTVAFYGRVNALLRPDMMVLDIGAGRGAELYDTTSPFRASLSTLKGKVQRLVGVDVDPAVLENPFLDEAQAIEIDGPLPFPDASFDLIYSDWVLEHVATPEHFTSEVRRVLKPGGWFCARTPNRWGMTGIAANLLPNSLHTSVLRHLQPTRQERDVFPTIYKLNTRGRLRRFFTDRDWENYSFLFTPEPVYFERSSLLLGLAKLALRFAPPAMGTDLHVFLRKR